MTLREPVYVGTALKGLINMSKKVRKKKNNRHERTHRMRRAYTSSYGVIRMNMEPCVVFDIARSKLVMKPSSQLTNALTVGAYKWTIMLLAGCRERNGKFKLVTDQITFSDRRTQEQLQDFLAQEHVAMVKQCEAVMDVEYVGWIGSPDGTIDFIPEHVEVLFDKLKEHYNAKETKRLPETLDKG